MPGVAAWSMRAYKSPSACVASWCCGASSNTARYASIASSTRFFSRKRLARSNCLLTSAAIRSNCLCGVCCLLNSWNRAPHEGRRSFSTIYRSSEAHKTHRKPRCGMHQGNGLSNAAKAARGKRLLQPVCRAQGNSFGAYRTPFLGSQEPCSLRT